jgi:methionine synthase / methylenetetrahydrofolate reductase(NADPH)
MTHPLTERLEAGYVLGDSAMGTMLFNYGHPTDSCLDELNLSHPEQVAQIHRANINAGADFVETNTFGANRLRLEQHGLGDKIRDINFRGVKIAREEREISGRPVLLAGSMGPTGRVLEPIGTFPVQEAYDAFREQAESLIEAGVDFFLIETVGDTHEMETAIRAVRDVADLPVMAMMTFGEDGLTMAGDAPETVVKHLAPLKVDVLGANCSVGPQRLLRVVSRMKKLIDTLDGHRPWVAAIPNAGWPTQVGPRLVYRSTPEYFAQFAQDAIKVGARIVGGCCGTTPEHTAAMREVVIAASPNGKTKHAATTPMIERPAMVFSETMEDDTAVKQALGKKFLTCVEIDPPKGLNPTKAIEGARMLKDAGVDAVNVADSPMARVRMSAMTLSYLIQQEVGIETILHYTTRDRSLMGLQSELLGAHAVGVRNILALTGDPPSLGDYADSTPVYDVDSIGLIRVIKQMNEGQDSAGASIGRTANFTIACAVDPTKPDLEDEARRLREKIAAGAHFVMTQPSFAPDVWTNFLHVFGAERLPIPVMIGILPLQSSKHAEFLHNEVPGITLTDTARERMRNAGKDGRQEGILMAQELLMELRPSVEGVYMMPSFGRYEVAAEVIKVLDE